MSLVVEIKINDTQIGRVTIRNQSNLADVSDYLVGARLTPSEFNEGVSLNNLKIEGHNRNQPVWSLIEKAMAAIINKGKVPERAKAYVVIDLHHNNGIDSVHLDPDKALIRQQEMRRLAARNFEPQWTEFSRDKRLLSICIKDYYLES